ncbi:hypothetical protein [Sulfobacillus thermosulfidooxidans]|uniref:hypothetical protein n=1 Tax=Sulfobacillus thermosulfidooxidans TaxID=28034 RepID=UPI00041ACEFD|nr:hypothetical protein [Sulfobacillus thermosulfidooxidans]
MIIVAVEHAGLEQFIHEEIVNHEDFDRVSIVHSWEEVRKLARRAQKILLGERILRHVSTEQLVKLIEQEPMIQWVIWTSEAEYWRTLLGEHGEVWEHTLGPDDLKKWLKVGTVAPRIHIPRRWFLWSTSGTVRRQLLWRDLLEKMKTQYQEGMTIDYDWGQALVTRLWESRNLPNENFPYARLTPQSSTWGWIVPAPMPWMPIFYTPDINDVKRVLAQTKSWMAWDLGINLRDPLTSLVISSLPTGLIFTAEEGTDDVFRHGLLMIKELNPQCEILLVGDQASRVGRQYGLPSLSSSESPRIAPGVLERWLRRDRRTNR